MNENRDPSLEKENASEEKQTFKQIFARHYGDIYQHLLRIVGQSSEAEDLTQMVFLRFHHHFDKVEPQKTKNWLYRVATNLGLNAVRDRKRLQNWVDKAAKQHDVLEKKKQQPEEEVLEKAERDNVRMALDKLSERDARLLYLYYAGLKNYRELAEEFGVKPSSIGTLLSRAKKAFKKVYHEME